MRRRVAMCLALGLWACHDAHEPKPPQSSERSDVCQAALTTRDAGSATTAFARNVILLVGDGVGAVHWQAAREEAGGVLAIDRLEGPVTYHTGSLTVGGPTDSAAAGTAIATGRCTENGMLGVTPDGEVLRNLFELARADGKRTGLLTNTVLVNATPMAFATHTASRYCADAIAAQLFEDSRPDVLLGGFMPDAAFSGPGLDERARDAGYEVGFSVAALLGRQATALADAGSGGTDTSEDAGAEAADTNGDAGAPGGGPRRVLGLFGDGPSVSAWPDWEYGLTPEALREADSDEPTLAELSTFALERLAVDGGAGFVLIIENEHADTVGHVAYLDPVTATTIMPSIVLELDRAVAAVLAWVDAHSSFQETLVVVAADHETGGYTLDAAADDDGGVSMPGFPASPSHTGVAVPVYARGPGSERLADVTHLTDLFHLLSGDLASLPGTGACPP